MMKFTKRLVKKIGCAPATEIAEKIGCGIPIKSTKKIKKVDYKQVAELAEKIGYKFHDSGLLELALCHRSFARSSNERLEFLGDAVLGLVIAAELYAKYPEYQEGDLSRLRASLVSRQTTAELALKLQFDKYIYLGKGEARSGGAQRVSILGNTFEAIIGALFLDSDLETCRLKILDWYQESLQKVTTPNEEKDPKSKLQEKSQAQHLPIPSYQVIKIEGSAHQQIFHVQCCIEGRDLVVEGAGTSRRQAEQNAARNYLATAEPETGK